MKKMRKKRKNNMKKLSVKGRRVLRIIFQALGTVVAVFGFYGCRFITNLFPVVAPAYGMPAEYGPGPGWKNIAIHGTVKTKTKAPVLGIKISVKDLSSYSFTNENGSFIIYVPEMESYKLKFEDIDGTANGSFKTLKKKIALSDTDTSLDICLEEADAE
jgi:putative lipoprotein (rSAM/lipoprotein system)